MNAPCFTSEVNAHENCNCGKSKEIYDALSGNCNDYTLIVPRAATEARVMKISKRERERITRETPPTTNVR